MTYIFTANIDFQFHNTYIFTANIDFQFHNTIEMKLPLHNTRVKLPTSTKDTMYEGKYRSNFFSSITCCQVVGAPLTIPSPFFVIYIFQPLPACHVLPSPLCCCDSTFFPGVPLFLDTSLLPRGISFTNVTTCLSVDIHVQTT